MKTKHGVSRLIGGLVGLAMIGMAGPANAVLIDNGMTTIDTDTGLEWLDLTETLGQSYNSVAAGFGGFTTTDGFRYATQFEVSTLFTNAGFSFQDNSFNAVDAAPAGLMLDLFGCTTVSPCNTATSVIGQGIADLGAFSPTLAALPIYQARLAVAGDFSSATEGASLVNNCCFSKSGGNLGIGSWLVRDVVAVPEPSSLAVFLIALGGLGFLARRRLAREAPLHGTPGPWSPYLVDSTHLGKAIDTDHRLAGRTPRVDAPAPQVP